jgi:hypothetical protein
MSVARAVKAPFRISLAPAAHRSGASPHASAIPSTVRREAAGRPLPAVAPGFSPDRILSIIQSYQSGRCDPGSAAGRLPETSDRSKIEA